MTLTLNPCLEKIQRHPPAINVMCATFDGPSSNFLFYILFIVFEYLASDLDLSSPDKMCHHLVTNVYIVFDGTG